MAVIGGLGNKDCRSLGKHTSKCPNIETLKHQINKTFWLPNIHTLKHPNIQSKHPKLLISTPQNIHTSKHPYIQTFKHPYIQKPQTFKNQNNQKTKGINMQTPEHPYIETLKHTKISKHHNIWTSKQPNLQIYKKTSMNMACS